MMKRMLLILGLILPVVVFASELEEGAEPNALKSTLAAIQQGTRSNQTLSLSASISRQLNERPRLRSDELARASVAADCIRYLRLTESMSLQAETEQWLLADADRLHLLVDSILPSDHLQRCFQCLEKLMNHDPVGREKYVKLMLALSVVWDQPERPVIHHQMGKKRLSYKLALPERYDYFKELYASGDATFSYETLEVCDLIFVVDTPVPLSELRWARENVKGSLEDWGDKFDDINYDTSRISASQYQWPNGFYTLADIQRKGGICVDQAYYAALTARAFGIPAMCFGAAGKSGSHQWFSYLKQPGEWALNVGRYESEEYTTGWTVDPQTNEDITDHDIIYASRRALDKKRMATSDVYIALADVLIDDPDNVRGCAKQSRKIDPQNWTAWQIEMDALIAAQDCRKLFNLFEDLRDVFKDYPDIVVNASEQIGAVLIEGGMQEEVASLQRRLVRKVDDERDDLARFLGMDEIEVLVDEGNIKKARREMEDLLEDHIEDGRKTFALIRGYLKITKNTDQAEAAAKFLDEYIEEMMDSFYFSTAYKEFFLDFLLTAYQQAGDEKGVAETQSRLKNL